MTEELTDLFQHFSLPAPTTCTLMAGGKNNQVYRLEFLGQESLVLKRYFQHPEDKRQRLYSEFSFLNYAWGLGLNCIPQPLASSASKNAALYSHVRGRSCEERSIVKEDVQQAIDFFLALNQQKEIAQVPIASEACFSLREHLDLVESRVNLLAASPSKQLQQFLQQDLLAAWKKVRQRLPDSTDLLEKKEWCLSPSDFGFHNALLREDGSFVFLDFEYAGWDDPAKTVCDFFCQPRVPIPMSFFNDVSERFASSAAHPEAALERIRHLIAVYRIKWCCILLNCFSSVGQTRRSFALSQEQQNEQLIKAKHYLTSWEGQHGLS